MSKAISIGLDISHWNTIDPHRIRTAGFDFVILKAGGADGGLYQDAKFEQMYNGCIREGLNVGCYFYMNAYDEHDAIEQAEFFASLCEGKKFDFPVFFDVEGEMLGADRLDEIVSTACRIMEQLGFFVGVYASASVFRNKLAPIKERFACWTACWVDRADEPPFDCGLWQFTSHWDIDGKHFDANYCYVDYPEEIKNKRLNGYTFNINDLIKAMKAISNGEYKIEYDANSDGYLDTKDLVKIMKELSK